MYSDKENLEIIVAKADDLDEVCALDALVLGDRRRREFLVESINDEGCYVTKVSNELAGLAVFQPQSFYGHGFIPLVVVHPDHRGKKVASGRLRLVESVCA